MGDIDVYLGHVWSPGKHGHVLDSVLRNAQLQLILMTFSLVLGSGMSFLYTEI